MAHILLVDDIAELREIYKSLLEELGHEVQTAVNGANAIDVAQQETFDFILMDIDMPELDGISAVRRLKHDPALSSLHQVPIVLLTSSASPSTVQEGLQAGGDAYIVKPVDPHELIEELTLLLMSDDWQDQNSGGLDEIY